MTQDEVEHIMRICKKSIWLLTLIKASEVHTFLKFDDDNLFNEEKKSSHHRNQNCTIYSRLGSWFTCNVTVVSFHCENTSTKNIISFFFSPHTYLEW